MAASSSSSRSSRLNSCFTSHCFPSFNGRLYQRAFISHAGAHADFTTADRLKDMMSPWATACLDYDSIPPGAAWRDSLKALSGTSKVFVAVISEHYFSRKWCMLELIECLRAKAADPDIVLVPLQLDILPESLKDPPADREAKWRELESAELMPGEPQLTVQQMRTACQQLAGIHAVRHYQQRKGDLRTRLMDVVKEVAKFMPSKRYYRAGDTSQGASACQLC